MKILKMRHSRNLSTPKNSTIQYYYYNRNMYLFRVLSNCPCISGWGYQMQTAKHAYWNTISQLSVKCSQGSYIKQRLDDKPHPLSSNVTKCPHFLKISFLCSRCLKLCSVVISSMYPNRKSVNCR